MIFVQRVMKNKLPSILSAYFLIATIVSLGMISLPVTGLAVDNPEGTKTDQEGSGGGQKAEDILKQLLPDVEGKGFVYKRKDRTDPFMPFITDERVQAELEVESKRLTGMQLFEPGQLTLVGIVNTEKRAMAMVQDSVGKGYLLHEGMKIGRTGEITLIGANTVLVREEASRNVRTKKITYKTTTMVLKKEGVNE